MIDCDVASAESLDACFAELGGKWPAMDFLVHAIAFSDKEQLRGRYVDTTSDNFAMTMNISCFSFTAVAQRAEKMMPNGGSLLTLTYYGAEKVMPHYNVMGVAKAALEASVRYLAEDLGKKQIRVNAISAGPIKTLAAAGIGDFRYILKWNELNAPLRRTVTTREVGDSALFLLSDLGRRPRSILMTSATTREGKTTTSVHLAIAHSLQGRKTLLIDADLRRPGIQSRLALPNDRGLSTIVSGEVDYWTGKDRVALVASEIEP
jgi:NAD(P)-dependent dehydrogenase (short-subunit alcohol dehydrogenase family)